MKPSQSNFNLQSPGSYLARSYLIATVTSPFKKFEILFSWPNRVAILLGSSEKTA